jgi:uncharacterized protein YcnI
MMKKTFLGFVVASLTLTVSGSAAAHVTVKPAQVAAAEYQVFTTGVPNEKDIPVTSVRLVLPAQITAVTPTAKQGWKIDVKTVGDNETEISWTSGSIDAGLRDEFTFSAQAPAKPGELVWKAYQTYADGSVAAWDQEPADEHGHGDEEATAGPYSTTQVVEEDQQGAVTTYKTDTGAYLLSGLALGLALLAYLNSRKKKV